MVSPAWLPRYPRLVAIPLGRPAAAAGPPTPALPSEPACPTPLSPAGLVQQGEDVTEAAEREVLEETGVRARFDGVIAMRQVRRSVELGPCRMEGRTAARRLRGGQRHAASAAAACARAHVQHVCWPPVGTRLCAWKV